MKEFKCTECNKGFNSEESLNQHMKAKHEQDKTKTVHKVKITKKHYLLMGALLISLALGFLLYNYLTSPGKYDNLAKCLSEKGFAMAGTDWCSNCKKQKNIFGKSFKYVNYQNCDTNKEWCESKGVERYPTWILPDGTRIEGTQDAQDLSRLSRCDI